MSGTGVRPGYCKCGAQLGRSGKCPALCEPVPEPAPKYRGPKIIGRSHLGRIGAPVYTPPHDPDGWIHHGWIG